MDKELNNKLKQIYSATDKERYIKGATEIWDTLCRGNENPEEFRLLISWLRDLIYPQWVSPENKEAIMFTAKAAEQHAGPLGEIFEEILTDMIGPSGKRFGRVEPRYRPVINLYAYVSGMFPQKVKDANRRLIAFFILAGTPSKEGGVHDAAKATGTSEAWVLRLIKEIETIGIDALKDRRESNGREPLYSKPEIIAFIAETIKGEPPDGLRWKGRHIAAMMQVEFSFPKVPIQRAIENLRRAERINRKNAG